MAIDTYLATYIDPITLISIVLLNLFMSREPLFVRVIMDDSTPALVTATWMVPNLAMVASTAAATSDSRETSHFRRRMLGPERPRD